MLFNLCVNDLAHEIQALHKGVTFDDDNISVLLHANDLVILAESPEDLQCQLNTLSQWCERWKLKVNSEKSNIVHFRPPSALRTSFLFKVDDMPLQVASSNKYLGKLLYEHLDYHVSVKVVLPCASRALGSVNSKSRANGGLPFDVL